MKVDRQQAIDFLKNIGFGNAPRWDDKKLSTHVALIPKKLKAEEVREPFGEFFKSLCDHKDEKIELTGKRTDLESVAKRVFQPEGEPTPPAKPEVSRPPTGEESGGGDISEDTEVPIGRVDRKKEPIVRLHPKKKKRTKKKATSKKSSRAKVDKDSLGYRKGTLSAKINAVLSSEWQTEAALVKKANVTTAQARGHFYQLRDSGLLEIEKVVTYRLKKKS